MYRLNMVIDGDYMIDIDVVEGRPVLTCVGDDFYCLSVCGMVFGGRETKIYSWCGSVDAMFSRVIDGILSHEGMPPEEKPEWNWHRETLKRCATEIKNAVDSMKRLL